MRALDRLPISVETGLSMNRLFQKLIIGIVIGVLVYVIGTIALGIEEVSTALGQFSFSLLVPVLILTLANYWLRFIKWNYYLNLLSITVPLKRNISIFLSGLSMVITPGKVGELLKAYLLKQSQGIEMSKTAPIVIAERLTDLIALLILMSLGLSYQKELLWTTLIIGAFILILLVIVGSKRFSLPIIRSFGRISFLSKITAKLESFYESSAILLKPKALAYAITLSIISWFFECLGTYLILGGFPNTHVPLLLATFIYSASTVGGLPTPGGIGLTDSGMVGLMSYLVKLSRPIAAAATLLVRLSTLWFAVIVGVLALLILRKEIGLSNSDDLPG